MMNLQLVMPCCKYWDSYKASYPEMSHEGLVKGMDWDEQSSADKYFQEALDMKNGAHLGDLVPASNFWIIANDQYVGRMSIRHELNDWLRIYGGHIGYEIKLSARRKGYATQALKQAISYCQIILEIPELLLTCNDENIASYKTIENNGGILFKKMNDEGGHLSRYYSITL
jgi:predicted acetyltransferase